AGCALPPVAHSARRGCGERGRAGGLRAGVAASPGGRPIRAVHRGDGAGGGDAPRVDHVRLAGRAWAPPTRSDARDRLSGVMRWLTAGESHGPALVAILEGVPAGVEVTSADLARELARRRLGYGRGARMSFEQDEVEIIGGVRHGRTLGSPVAVRVGNTEWPKWQQVMAADPVDPAALAGLARNAPLTRPRPGHADLAGMQKYGWWDARPVLERASARETAARVALGAVARALLHQGLGV